MSSVIDPFYKELIEIWKSGGKNGGPGGWAGYYYGIFSKCIKENDFKNCVEVGIGYGFHAKEILDNTNVEKLYLIDPMCYYPNDVFADDVLHLLTFQTPILTVLKKLKSIKSIVGISPTMVLLFLLLFLFLKK
jgi:hypothetical protein